MGLCPDTDPHLHTERALSRLTGVVYASAASPARVRQQQASVAEVRTGEDRLELIGQQKSSAPIADVAAPNILRV